MSSTFWWTLIVDESQPAVVTMGTSALVIRQIHTQELSDTDKIRGAYGEIGTRGLSDPLIDAVLIPYNPSGVSYMPIRKASRSNFLFPRRQLY